MAIYRGSGGSVEGITDADILTIAISQGGTGANNVADARSNLGLGSAALTSSSDYATASQGALADSAIQPDDLATVATTGSYDDLSNKPTIPTTLDSLTDVVITSATTGQGLQFNGTNWVNSSAGSGTVSSVAMTVPTGLSVSGSPVTTTGTLAVTLTSGYAIPTTAKQTEWDTAYTDRNKWDGGATGLTAATGRASLGLGTAATTDATAYATAAQGAKADTALQSETYTGTVTSVAMTVPTGLSIVGSPVTTTGTLAVTLTAGYSIPTTADQTNWTTAYGWGNHASAGYAADSAVVKLTGNQTVAGTKTFSSTIVGSISGNAGTVTNGVVTTGSYSDPSWITALAGPKITGTIDGGTY